MKLWGWNHLKELWARQAHGGRCNGVAISACGKYVISAGDDRCVCAISSLDGTALGKITLDSSALCVAAGAVHASSKCKVVVGDSSGVVHCIDLVVKSNAGEGQR